MLPEIEIFGIALSLYGFFTAIGIILMTVIVLFLSKKNNLSPIDIIVGEIIALICGFVGAHLLYSIINLPSIISSVKFCLENNYDFKTLLNMLYHNINGMVFYGGLIFALIGGLIYCKVKKLNTSDYSDCFAVGIPLFHCFGRIGCFFSGCCYGIESDFGFTFTNSLITSGNNVNRFPVQLLEAGLNLALFFVILILFHKKLFKGSLILIYLNLYSIIRFCDEFLRGDSYRGIYFGLSTSQWISLVLFIFSSFMLMHRYKKALFHSNELRKNS